MAMPVRIDTDEADAATAVSIWLIWIWLIRISLRVPAPVSPPPCRPRLVLPLPADGNGVHLSGRVFEVVTFLPLLRRYPSVCVLRLLLVLPPQSQSQSHSQWPRRGRSWE